MTTACEPTKTADAHFSLTTPLGWLRLNWLTGPILDKEMRVASRRRRNFWLRVIYVALMTGLIALIWLVVDDKSSRSYNQASNVYRMSEIGKSVILAIVWFQFIMGQLVAIVSMSTSISDEIYRRTLGVLMTTPINSLQIVMGKLTSKLLQILVLLGISLPVLAVVRVFGGVPWGFVVHSLCLTLVSLLFVSSVAMFFSIFTRRAYLVILQTILALGVFYLGLPLLASYVCYKSHISERVGLPFLALFHPPGVMVYESAVMSSARMGMGGLWVSWLSTCVAMLIVTACLLALCIKMVRKVALRQVSGDVGKRAKPGRALIVPPPLPAVAAALETMAPPPPAMTTAARTPVADPIGNIRRVTGSPILWKERRAPLLKGTWPWVALIGTVAILLITYLICASEHAFRDHETNAVYAAILTGLAMLVTMVITATPIAAEKEARSWGILLLTGQSDWRILRDKALGALRRCLPCWVILFAHVGLFTAVGLLHPIVLVHLLMIMIWVTTLLACSGLYFSAAFRHTTTAVIMNIAFALALWAIVPFLLVITVELGNGRNYTLRNTVEDLAFLHPIYQAGCVADAVGPQRYYGYDTTFQDWRQSRPYDWGRERSDAVGATWRIALSGVLYAPMAAIFFFAARRKMRKGA